MVLPFFGKKPVPAGSSAPRSRAGTGAAPSRSPSAESASRHSGGPRTETSSLDFTIAGGDLKGVLAECAGKLNVEEGVGEMVPAVEEAAILYANGADGDARQVLEGALEGMLSTHDRFVLWGMLLDLLRLSGQKERFEALSLAYATEFERSPPPWQDLSGQAPRAGGGRTQTVTLSGVLAASAAAQFAQLIQIAMRTRSMRIELTRLRGVEPSGAELLLRAVRGLRRAGVKLTLAGVAHLVNLLSVQVRPGHRENQTHWLLLLEVLQFTDESDRFEELALDYAMTFEESPPSWEPPLALTTSQVEAVSVSEEPDAYVLEGEIAGPNTEILRKITAFAGDRTKVEIDCSRLRRMDFVSAGTLFNIVSQLHAQGRLVIIKGVNSMVGALMQVMSLHQVARIEPRS